MEDEDFERAVREPGATTAGIIAGRDASGGSIIRPPEDDRTSLCRTVRRSSLSRGAGLRLPARRVQSRAMNTDRLIIVIGAALLVALAVVGLLRGL
jgi:hypothetical protein